MSGGQTGVDRFALDWAIRNNISHGGWCPKGRRSEDGLIPIHYDLKESASTGYKSRTRKNVRDAHGTLLLTPTRELTGGTLLTRNIAQNNYLSHLLHLCPGDKWHGQIKSFISQYSIEILNVAGPRESSLPPDFDQFVYAVLNETLGKDKKY
ncbi:MAG: putative molybdenum carrier protein [Nitrosomonas sp.]|nr:putative molybdenum carrier protein [Nitrosomonas sp.]MBA3978206.1 putative molybdenum carrier protein [Nitrosopumilus sp.]